MPGRGTGRGRPRRIRKVSVADLGGHPHRRRHHRKYGHLDILVNNASIAATPP